MESHGFFMAFSTLNYIAKDSLLWYNRQNSFGWCLWKIGNLS